MNHRANGNEYPMLVDMTSASTVSREARGIFGTKCAADRIALLGSSPMDRILANCVLSGEPLPCPNRFFDSRDDAVGWL